MGSRAEIHILVVEDDAQYRRLVTRMLEQAGYRVTAAENFTTAIPVIEGEGALDLLLVDVGMPAGTPHGLSIAKMAELRRSNLKVVYMSGSNPEGYALFGDRPLLRKPFSARDLIATIEAALG